MKRTYLPCESSECAETQASKGLAAGSAVAFPMTLLVIGSVAAAPRRPALSPRPTGRHGRHLPADAPTGARGRLSFLLPMPHTLNPNTGAAPVRPRLHASPKEAA